MQPHFTGENIISVERKYIDVPLSAITASTLPVSSRPSQPVQEMGNRLLELAKKGDSEGVRELMSCGAPFSTDWLGTSPLHFAAQHNHLETVEMLLRAGISRDARNKVERTPLHVAAQEGHVEVCRLLINFGADVDCRDMLKMTPLHWGAEKGHSQVIRLLLDFGADPLVLNKFDKSPHDIAHDNSYLDIMEMLQDAATLDPISRKVLKNQSLVSSIENNLQSVPDQSQLTQETVEPITILPDNSDEIQASTNGMVLKIQKVVGRRKVNVPKTQLPLRLMQSENINVEFLKPSDNKMTTDKMSEIESENPLTSNVTSNNSNNSNVSNCNNFVAHQRQRSQLQNERLPTETQTATSTLQMLQEHGITMLPVDDSSIVASAVQSGQTVVLTEAGKMALNLIKLNSTPSPRNVNSSTNVGVVKKLPMTTKHVKTNNFPTQKILIDGRKLIRVQPEELINMTREKKVIIHTGDKRLGRPGQIIFSKPIRQITPSPKPLDVQNRKVTSSELRNVNSSVKTVVKSVEVKCEKNLKDFEEITKQLEEARREAEMYKEQLMLKEKEAEQYKLQLQSLVSGK